MRVGVDAREICNRPAGKGQYLLRLLKAWNQSNDFELVLCIEDGQELPGDVKGGNVQVLKEKGGLLWHRRIAKRLPGERIDVYFAALSYLSAIWNTVPTVTVVHDLAVFRLPNLAHNRKAKLIERFSLKRSVRRSVAIVAVSEATKRDVLEIGKADPGKVQVVYEAAMSDVRIEKPLPFSGRKNYILFTGTLEPRKNIPAVLRAYAGLSPELRESYRLKLAGKPGWGGEDYQGLAKELGIDSRTDFLGYVSDSELDTFLKEAAVFMYPSLYEGFGLPVIEAMAVGTPVITSSVSSLPEVVGPEGVACEPHDVAEMTVQLEKLLTDPAFHKAQSQYLFERSKTFSWKKASMEITDILKKVSR